LNARRYLTLKTPGMNKYLIIILSIVLTNCSTKKENSYTYFGGKIINPKSDYLLLYKTHKVIDTLKLTNKNTFMSKLKNITPGLYFFKHGLEHQYVYLEPKDSLLIRLNTWGFDESLVFSGIGAEKNNVLIETFLQNEDDNKKFARYYGLKSDKFKSKIDSIAEEKNKILTDFKINNPTISDGFIDILNVALNYPIHTKAENYIRENNLKKTSTNLDLFLSHRERTSINRDSLMFYIPYRNYVYAHLFGNVYKQKLKKGTPDFTKALLKNIHSKISSDKQRNRLLRHVTIRDFYNNSSGNINKEIFETYFSLTTSEKDKKQIKKLIEDIEKIKEKEKLPSFSLVRANKKVVDIDNLTKNKKTVIYFKGKRRSSNEWLASRVDYLMAKNRDTQFLIVNVDDTRDTFIKKLDIKHQYSLEEKSEAHKFLNCQYPRVILVNEDGIIENSFAALSSDKIEKQIAGL